MGSGWGAPPARNACLARAKVDLTQRDFLIEYLSHAPAALALLRAIECRELSAFAFRPPVLDLGCGDGIFADLFFQDGPLVGVDRSPHELSSAVRRDVYGASVCADIAHLPFSDGAFATIFSNGVLEHVLNLEGGLAEIARVLRPDGELICTVPTMEDERQLSGAALLRALGLHTLARRYADAYNRAFGQVNLREPEAWRECLAAHGLELAVCRRYAGAAVFRLHDLSLPISVFHWALKRLTGQWVLSPRLRRQTIARIWAGLLRAHYEDTASPGCSLLMIARPSASG